MPRGILFDHTQGRGHTVPPCINPDRKMHLTWNLTVILCNVTIKMVEKPSQYCSYGDDDVANYVNILKKNYGKNGWNMFLSKTNLVRARKSSFWKSR